MSQEPEVQKTALEEMTGQDPNNASDPMGTVMSFLNVGLMFGAANSIMGAIQGGAVQVAGYTPGGTGFEPAMAELAPANTPTAPTMTRTVSTPGMNAA